MKKVICFMMGTIFAAFAANSYYVCEQTGLWWLFLPAFASMVLCLMCAKPGAEIPGKRLKICGFGANCLKLFLSSLVISIGIHIYLLVGPYHGLSKNFWLSALVCFLVEAVIFWVGMISVFTTSKQLGVRYRVKGFLCGLVPILNLFVLVKMLCISCFEVSFETLREKRNEERAGEQVCATKYPLLLVHGVFFRDFKYLNYWGRIPEELEKNGATIYYGEHQSAASVADCGKELAERIRAIVEETGCEKVNCIAHSKGGLDMRYALSEYGMQDYVASLTTINTPHRGCEFADYLLDKIPQAVKDKISGVYNTTLRKLGDQAPDFMAAVTDLTASSCKTLNEKLKDPEGVVCASVGSKLNQPENGRFPLNFSYRLVKHFDGANDGLVSESSFEWGTHYEFLTVAGKRGISHGDVIDLNREDIPKFDVREYYVQLVKGLKERGL